MPSAELPPAEPTAAGPPLAAPSFRRALGHPAFRYLWLSQLVSQSGDYIFEVALIWLVLERTGSVFAVSLVIVVALLPTVLLGPVLGVYADRWPRRTILLGTNIAEGVLVAALSGLVLAGDASFAVILAIVFALSVGGQFVRVASNAMIPQTVGKEDLGPANSLMTFSTSSTQIVGLSLGGIVVALFGVTAPIAYDAISFFLAAGLMLMIASSVGRPEPSPDGHEETFSQQFREGLRTVASHRILVEVIVIGMVINFAGNATFALWAPYADDVLHGGAAVYGFLGAMIAFGAIVGAVVIGKVRLQHRAGWYMLGGLLGIGALFAGLGITRSIPVALAICFVVGVLTSVVNIPLFTVVQAKIPARVMGRVMSVLLSLVLAAAPFGAFFAGAVASRTSIGFVYVLGGVIVIATGLLALAFSRTLRDVTY